MSAFKAKILWQLTTSHAQKLWRDLTQAAAAQNPIGSVADTAGYGPTAQAHVLAAQACRSDGCQEYRVAAHPDLFTLFGGIRHVRYDDWQAVAVSYPNGQAVQNTGRVAFMTDAPRFDLLVGISQTARYRILVDGLYIDRAGILTAKTQGARDYLSVSVPNAQDGSPEMRRIDLEMYSPEGAFGGAVLPTGAKIDAINVNRTYRIACFGDSLASGTGCQNQNDGFATVAAYLLGGVNIDLLQISLGGTGFINNGPAWRAMAHIDDLTRQPVDEVWIEMGINDPDERPLEAAALHFFQNVRKRLPGVPIIVLGIARDDSAKAVERERRLAAAFHKWKDPKSGWVPFQTGPQKLFTGGLGQGGNFSADRYGGGIDGRDNTHPNVAGHLHMGRFVARARQAMTWL